MKKLTVSFMALISVFLFAVSVNAFFSSRMGKANDFIKAKMFPQAIAILEEEINEKPTNAEAHFQLAILYIHTQATGRAKERFGSAYNLDPGNYGKKIAQVYFQSGNLYLDRGFTSKAINEYREALNFDSGLASAIAEKSFNKGIFFLDPEKLTSSTADQLFHFAAELSPNYQDKFKPLQIEYAHKCLEIAKSQTKANREPYLKEAGKYLDQKAIHEVFPPPSWKTVFKKEYVGVGYAGGDEPKYNDGGIKTAIHGQDIFIGDRCTVIDSDFELWIDGVWKSYPKGYRIVAQQIEPGKRLVFRNSKGKPFTVVVERLK